MEHIVKEFLTNLARLPKAFGEHPVGGILITIILLYSLHLGAPILANYFDQTKKPDVRKIEEGPNNSGTYKVNSRI